MHGVAVLGVIWALVWAVVSWSSGRKATPEKVTGLIEEGDFEDWSKLDPSSFSQEQKEARLKRLDEMGEVLSQLDIRERKQLDEEGNLTDLFSRLSKEEELYFVNLILTKNVERLMETLDDMDAEEREQFVQRGVREMTDGRGAEVLARLKKDNPEILNEVIKQGFKAYFQGASASTKMDLLPFMSAVGEVVQGFAKPGAGGL